jgi:hypothetical protein
MWKWDDISMDFIVGLPQTAGKKDSIWVKDRMATGEGGVNRRR